MTFVSCSRSSSQTIYPPLWRAGRFDLVLSLTGLKTYIRKCTSTRSINNTKSFRPRTIVNKSSDLYKEIHFHSFNQLYEISDHVLALSSLQTNSKNTHKTTTKKLQIKTLSCPRSSYPPTGRFDLVPTLTSLRTYIRKYRIKTKTISKTYTSQKNIFLLFFNK